MLLKLLKLGFQLCLFLKMWLNSTGGPFSPQVEWEQHIFSIFSQGGKTAMFSQTMMVMALRALSAGGIYLLQQAPGQESRSPWWLFWLLIVLALLGVLGWWWSSQREKPARLDEVAPPAPIKPEAIQAHPMQAAEVPTAPVQTEDIMAELEEELPPIRVEETVTEFEEELPPIRVEETVTEFEEELPPIRVEETVTEFEEELPPIRFGETVAELEEELPPIRFGETVAELEEELPPMPVEADDLTVIEGIGPKIARTLEAAGIGTFRELASAEVSRLVEILSQDRNLRMHNPESWPEQARLAAAGEWAALQTMQAGLRGGRQAE
jgi:hypothetical protein